VQNFLKYLFQNGTKRSLFILLYSQIIFVKIQTLKNAFWPKKVHLYVDRLIGKYICCHSEVIKIVTFHIFHKGPMYYFFIYLSYHWLFSFSKMIEKEKNDYNENWQKLNSTFSPYSHTLIIKVLRSVNSFVKSSKMWFYSIIFQVIFEPSNIFVSVTVTIKNQHSESPNTLETETTDWKFVISNSGWEFTKLLRQIFKIFCNFKVLLWSSYS